MFHVVSAPEEHPTLGRVDNEAGLFHGRPGTSGFYLALAVCDAAVRACADPSCATCIARVRRRPLFPLPSEIES